MGLFKGCSANSAPAYTTDTGQPTDGNPKANRFIVGKFFQNKQRIAVVLTYPDAINYKGQKILVFEDVAKFWEHVRLNDVDPHFLEKRYSPLARFEPTERGWKLACDLVKIEI